MYIEHDKLYNSFFPNFLGFLRQVFVDKKEKNDTFHRLQIHGNNCLQLHQLVLQRYYETGIVRKSFQAEVSSVLL